MRSMNHTAIVRGLTILGLGLALAPGPLHAAAPKAQEGAGAIPGIDMGQMTPSEKTNLVKMAEKELEGMATYPLDSFYKDIVNNTLKGKEALWRRIGDYTRSYCG